MDKVGESAAENVDVSLSAYERAGNIVLLVWKGAKMKRVALVCAMMLVLSSTGLAIDFMGSPVAQYKEGKVNAGFTWCMSEFDYEVEGYGKADDLETTKYYGNIGYGINDQWDIWALLGLGNAEYEETGLSFDGDNGFSWGLGTRFSFYEQDNMRWGSLFQITWSDSEDTISGVDIEYDVYELQVAIGPEIDMGGWRLYGGPFFYKLEGDFTVASLISVDIEEDSSFGGYIGGGFDIAENTALNVEYSLTGAGYALGVNIGVGF